MGAVRLSTHGKQEEQKSISATIEPVAEGWLKITPSGPLASGEYGLVELSKGDADLNAKAPRLPENIWDFGIDPVAPANPLALKPEVSGAPAVDQPPAAQQRPENPKEN